MSIIGGILESPWWLIGVLIGFFGLVFAVISLFERGRKNRNVRAFGFAAIVALSFFIFYGVVVQSTNLNASVASNTNTGLSLTQVSIASTQTVLAEENSSISFGTSTSEITSLVKETSDLPLIIPTPTPISVGIFVVPGNSTEGYRFNVTVSGIYYFRYVSGSYSTYPIDRIPTGTPTWLTSLRVFRNRPSEWNGIAISDFPDINAFDTDYSFSSNQAESKVVGQIVIVTLSAGEYLIFVAVDEKPYYSDNPGEIVIEVLFTPNN